MVDLRERVWSSLARDSEIAIRTRGVFGDGMRK